MGQARDTVAALLDRAAKKDMEGMTELMAEDLIIHCSGRSRFAGDHKGKDGFFAFFGGLVKASDGTFMPKVHEIAAQGDHVVALLELSAERDGKKAQWSQANVYHVREGKVTEVWILPEDQYRFDEFWG